MDCGVGGDIESNLKTVRWRFTSLTQKTELTDRERQFVQKRLSEERFTIALLEYMSGPKGFDVRSGALE